jgi:hypothetical protein
MLREKRVLEARILLLAERKFDCVKVLMRTIKENYHNPEEFQCIFDMHEQLITFVLQLVQNKKKDVFKGLNLHELQKGCEGKSKDFEEISNEEDASLDYFTLLFQKLPISENGR